MRGKRPSRCWTPAGKRSSVLKSPGIHTRRVLPMGRSRLLPGRAPGVTSSVSLRSTCCGRSRPVYPAPASSVCGFASVGSLRAVEQHRIGGRLWVAGSQPIVRTRPRLGKRWLVFDATSSSTQACGVRKDGKSARPAVPSLHRLPSPCVEPVRRRASSGSPRAPRS